MAVAVHKRLLGAICKSWMLCDDQCSQATRWCDRTRDRGTTPAQHPNTPTIPSKTVKEKDLGVTMNANMKLSEQCRIAASKGNQVLGMIRRNITYKEKSLIIPLYKAIVRPHLEYCIQAWNPYLRKDVDMLEKIQRRATKLIPGLRDLT